MNNICQGDGEDPEVLGVADGAGNRRGGVDPGGHGGARATEERGGAEGMKEPDGARGRKGQGEAGGVESWDAGWLTPDQGGAEWMREPVRASGLPSHGGEEGARSHGGGRASEAGSRETPTTAMLEDGSPAELAPHRWWAEEEQRGCQTT